MIKSELIQLISGELSHLPEKQIGDMVNHILQTMTETLAAGRRIEIRGFGSFAVHYHPPRTAHNPKTGDKLITKGARTPHFKPGKSLKEKLND